MDNSKLIHNIKTLMFWEGLNKTKFAKKAGVLRVSLSNILNGKTDPSLQTVTKIAKAFDIEVDSLLNKKLEPLDAPNSKLSLEQIEAVEGFDEAMDQISKMMRGLKAVNRDKLTVQSLDDVELRNLLVDLYGINLAEIYKFIERAKAGKKQAQSMSLKQRELFDIILRISDRTLSNENTFAELRRTLEAAADQHKVRSDR